MKMKKVKDTKLSRRVVIDVDKSGMYAELKSERGYSLKCPLTKDRCCSHYVCFVMKKCPLGINLDELDEGEFKF